MSAPILSALFDLKVPEEMMLQIWIQPDALGLRASMGYVKQVPEGTLYVERRYDNLVITRECLEGAMVTDQQYVDEVVRKIMAGR